MEPELLKKIAERIKWSDVHTQHLNGLYVVLGIPDNCSMQEVFDPQNNPAQLLEITEKFKIELKHAENEVWSKIWNRGVWMPYKTLTEAVLNEAEEFVK